MVSALAIICIRNEAIHIRRCLNDIIRSGLEVVLIDNDSTDESVEIAKTYVGSGLLRIDRLPYEGSFSMSEQLAAKQRIIETVTHDWIVNADADEWLCSPIAGQSLLEGIQEADEAGSTCINFHEFVFVPQAGENFYSEGYADRMTSYYFFQPTYPRLVRAWKRSEGLSNVASGGHTLAGANVRRFERDYILRHYIALSEAHARRKYVGRKFADHDLAKGWHRRRVGITAESLRLTHSTHLKQLPYPSSQEFDLSAPLAHHFWQW